MYLNLSLLIAVVFVVKMDRTATLPTTDLSGIIVFILKREKDEKWLPSYNHILIL